MIGLLHVDADGVEFAQLEIGEMIGRAAAVVGDGDAAVGGGNHVVGIFGVDPEAAEIAEGGDKGIPAATALAQTGPGFAAVVGLDHVGAGDEHPVGIVGIDAELVEGIAGLTADVFSFRADAAPGAAGVVGAIDFAADIGSRRGERSIALLRSARAEVEVVDDGVYDVGILAADIESDAAGVALRQTAGHLVPFGAAVGGFVDAAAGARLHDLPGEPDGIIHGGVQDVRIAIIDRQVDRAAGVVDEQFLLPGMSAVGRLEDAAFLIGCAQVAERGYPDDVGIGGVDDDAGDVLGVAQTHVGPGIAAVGGLVDAVAPVGAAGERIIAGAHPDHVGIRRRHRERADGGDSYGVGDRLPGGAVIGSAPHAAGARPREHGVAMGVLGSFRNGQ